MKYSLFKENPIWYLDIYAESILEKGRIRLKPLDGQSADSSLRIECSRKLRKKYGVGTVFKLDVRLVKPQNKKPYLICRNRKELRRALEYFERNRQIQIQYLTSSQLSLF
ncbi:hypothetical protein [Flectobacillus major]|jgi:hypothetical protein|uniref:hypothetical protein n=1 Tax=Flectobacillus major TaxID=103 RepID=UPI0004088BA7|nr:hypothetical protein [Flectobacillus major]